MLILFIEFLYTTNGARKHTKSNLISAPTGRGYFLFLRISSVAVLLPISFTKSVYFIHTSQIVPLFIIFSDKSLHFSNQRVVLITQ